MFIFSRLGISHGNIQLWEKCKNKYYKVISLFCGFAFPSFFHHSSSKPCENILNHDEL